MGGRGFWAWCFLRGWRCDGFGAFDDRFDGTQFKHFGWLKRGGDVGNCGNFDIGDDGRLGGEGVLWALGIGGRGSELLFEEDAIARRLVAGAEDEGGSDGG